MCHQSKTHVKTLLELQHTLSYPLDNHQRVHNKFTQIDRKSAITHNGTAFSTKRDEVFLLPTDSAVTCLGDSKKHKVEKS